MNKLRYAWYGDDFTGATDTLATVAAAGLDALLFLGVPTPERLARAGALDAIGIAGAARSMDADAMRVELAPVARFFGSLPAPLLHYKCCSTFDSAPGIGNLALAAELLAPAARQRFLPVVGGQPNLARYCAFGTLFAAAGDGTVHRLDRHPTMSLHPVTPMHEADLRRHFAALGLAQMGLVDWRTLEGSNAAIDARVANEASNPREAVLFDALDNSHLPAIGRVLWERASEARVLALGPSSVAQSLVAHWRALGELAAAASVLPPAPAQGPVFVLAGSRSPVTASQIEQASSDYARVEVDAGNIVTDAAALEALAARCASLLANGRCVLAQIGPVRAGGPTALDVAHASGRLLAAVLQRAPHVRRVGVAGGDTSSLALRALDIWGLRNVAGIAPGVPLVRAHSDRAALDGLELMLKGGQMGPPELFDLLRGS